MLGTGLMTTLLSLHGQMPPGMVQAALMALAVPVDSTRLFRDPKPMDLVRAGVVVCATGLLCLHGNLPLSFLVEAAMSLAVPGDPTRWRRGGPAP